MNTQVARGPEFHRDAALAEAKVQALKAKSKGPHKRAGNGMPNAEQRLAVIRDPLPFGWFARTLIIAPHPDDETIALGGTICRLRANGCEVYIEVGVAGYPESLTTYEERLMELRRAAKRLGVDRTKINIQFNGMDTRLDVMPSRDLIGWIDCVFEKLRPTAVLFPYPSHHQDHRAIFHATVAALREPKQSLRFAAAYEYPYIELTGYNIPPCKFCVNISRHHIKTKVRALREYLSQNPSHSSHPLHPDNVVRFAQFRGLSAGVQYAEVFYPVHMQA